MSDELPRPRWKMDWTAEALREFASMPEDGKQLFLAARAELITASDPYYRGIDADVSLPHWLTVRPLASTSPGGPHIADLAARPGLAHLHPHPSSRRSPDHRHRRVLGLTGNAWPTTPRVVSAEELWLRREWAVAPAELQ
ncbi:hypothetical protein [Streptomyces agglomeratus]|uniref:hypothetical protein n=1 Tax=Streptomyces agglomeratus TaxID=285458 RepID=UPI000A4162B8|nr:hypothetical protein [Streptomyces agglomeratus]